MHLWPVPFEMLWYVMHLEDKAHTNGWFQTDSEYDGEGKPAKVVGSIALQGKRVPVHPAMTRYTIAHEYGHAVEEAIAIHRGNQVGTDAILGEYATIRGLGESPRYGGGNWHLSVGEVFANDFRILIARSEIEYWPHPGVPRPEECPQVAQWWKAVQKETMKIENGYLSFVTAA